MQTKLTSEELVALRKEEEDCLARVTSIQQKLNSGSAAVTQEDLAHWQAELFQVQTKLIAAGEVPQSADARHTQMLGRTSEVGTTVYRDILGDEVGRLEVDMKTIIDGKFAAGEGVLSFSKDTPDAVIVLAIKQGLAAGKPFTVKPV